MEGFLTKQQAVDTAGDWKTSPEQLRLETNYTHIFSHVEWQMTAYYITCRQMDPALTWMTESELEEQVAMPSAFRPFLDIWKQTYNDNQRR